MITDTTQDAQLRRTIQKKIENEMPLQLLKRIVYEVRCEEMGIRPDGWKLYPEDWIQCQIVSLNSLVLNYLL